LLTAFCTLPCLTTQPLRGLDLPQATTISGVTLCNGLKTNLRAATHERWSMITISMLEDVFLPGLHLPAHRPSRRNLKCVHIPIMTTLMKIRTAPATIPQQQTKLV